MKHCKTSIFLRQDNLGLKTRRESFVCYSFKYCIFVEIDDLRISGSSQDPDDPKMICGK